MKPRPNPLFRVVRPAVRILALDTSTDWCSVALADGARVLAQAEHAPRLQAERLLPMIDAVLAQAGLVAADLDGIAFGRGPGAFTGVRLATAVAQGIAFGLVRPVVPVSTLAALAHGAWRRHGHARVVAALDARMDEVYAAAYACTDGVAATVLADALGPAAAVPLPADGHWWGCGSGFVRWGDALAERMDGRLDGTDAEAAPLAHDIALLARADFVRGTTVRAADALPVYLRDEVTAR